jgi:DNA-binding NarL/FixJ family response regulator
MRQFVSRLIARLFRWRRYKKANDASYTQAVPAGASLKPAHSNRLMLRSKKPRLMAVDPDPSVLNFITDIASPWYSVIGARDPGWAKAWLLQHKDIVACVTGEKLPAANGVDLLTRCRTQQPSMLRVLVTPDIDAAGPVGALIEGVAHRLVESPMCPENLGMAIDPMQLRNSSGVTITSRPKLLAA